MYHQLLAHDALGEAREVLDFGGGGELAASGGSVGHEAFIEGGCTGCQSLSLAFNSG